MHTHTLSTKGLNNSCFGIKTFTHLVPVERKGGRVRENERERDTERKGVKQLNRTKKMFTLRACSFAYMHAEQHICRGMFLPRLRPYGRPSGRSVVHITNPTPKEVPSRVSWQILSVAMEAPKGSIRFIRHHRENMGESSLKLCVSSLGIISRLARNSVC